MKNEHDCRGCSPDAPCHGCVENRGESVPSTVLDRRMVIPHFLGAPHRGTGRKGSSGPSFELAASNFEAVANSISKLKSYSGAFRDGAYRPSADYGREARFSVGAFVPMIGCPPLDWVTDDGLICRCPSTGEVRLCSEHLGVGARVSIGTGGGVGGRPGGARGGLPTDSRPSQACRGTAERSFFVDTIRFDPHGSATWPLTSRQIARIAASRFPHFDGKIAADMVCNLAIADASRSCSEGECQGESIVTETWTLQAPINQPMNWPPADGSPLAGLRFEVWVTYKCVYQGLCQ